MAGVLARVASLFGRRAFNIDSLTVSATTDPSDLAYVDHRRRRREDPRTGHEAGVKLYEVLWVEQLWEEDSYCKELVFVKLSTPDGLSRDAHSRSG